MSGVVARALLCLALLLAGGAPPAAAATPEEALERLLGEVRASLPAACGEDGADALVRVLCTGTLRVGVRDDYPLFATGEGGERRGYDIDVARAIAARLGVAPEWVPVTPASRIPALADGSADVVIATMGHNTGRDGAATFIRPHYYRSETIVVGPRDVPVAGWADLAGRSVCTTIGNYTNAHIVSQDVRVMLFDSASRLPEALEDETCRLAAQDDSFFASALADPAFAARFERKFGFDPVPWGMAVALTGSERLAEALSLLARAMHRDGTFLALARKHGIFTAFLEEQAALWREPACAGPGALDDPACVIAPLDMTPPPTPFAEDVEVALAWMERRLGFSPALPMLMTEPAWALFTAGIVNSLVLVAGALAATLAFALLVGWLAAMANLPARALAWGLVVTLQSSPVLLTLVVVSAVANALFAWSAMVAIGAAVVALGLMNGCNAGQAIGEAARSLRREEGLGRRLTPALFAAAVGRSITQILSFLVNAAKGTPVASFTGAPELLGALTDITSFSAGRVTTYTIVLVFYVVVVMVVVWGCNRVRARIERGRDAP